MNGKCRVCPRCGCIYSDGRSECIDCGVFTRAATSEDIEALEEYMDNASRKGLRDTIANGGRELDFKKTAEDSLAQAAIELAVRTLFSW